LEKTREAIYRFEKNHLGNRKCLQTKHSGYSSANKEAWETSTIQKIK